MRSKCGLECVTNINMTRSATKKTTTPTQPLAQNKPFTEARVKAIEKPGMHPDPSTLDRGLYLKVTPSGTKSWVFRYRSRTETNKNGNVVQRYMGLGRYGPRDVTVAQAREAAAECRQQLRNGIDPIDQRRNLRAALKAATTQMPTFRECCEKYIQAQAAGWKNPKHKAQWENTLRDYAGPVMGKLPVDQIDDVHVLAAIEPIWYEKTETASRLRSRIERVLDWATARKYREGENPARWRGHLDTMLPKPGRLKRVRHHPSLPYPEMYNFMRTLEEHEGVSARALRFLILTACRTSEVTGTRWSEIDLHTKVWSVPAERMKANRPHRIPLSDDAIDILKQQAGYDSIYVFPGTRAGNRISAAAMPELLKQLRPEVTCHGMRSSFRTWVAERTSYPREVAEAALAHTNRNKVEAAYLHSDHLEKRAELMNAWATYINNEAEGAAKQ